MFVGIVLCLFACSLSATNASQVKAIHNVSVVSQRLLHHGAGQSTDGRDSSEIFLGARTESTFPNNTAERVLRTSRML